MNIRQAIIFSAISTLTLSAHALADSTGLMDRNIPPQKNSIIFPNGKGEVIFNHSIHSKRFKEDDCTLCHRTNQSTHSKVLTRFDNHRIAHYFCKGCHRKVESGPTECHECHNYKKKT